MDPSETVGLVNPDVLPRIPILPRPLGQFNIDQGEFSFFKNPTSVTRESRLLVGGLSPSFATARPLENIGLVCIFIDRMFVAEDLLFECRN